MQKMLSQNAPMIEVNNLANCVNNIFNDIKKLKFEEECTSPDFKTLLSFLLI